MVHISEEEKQGGRNYKLESEFSEFSATRSLPPFSPLFFLFFLFFLSAGRFPLCAGKYGYWLLAPDSYPPADKGLPFSPAHPLQPQIHISFPGRASEWFSLVVCHEGVGWKGLGHGTHNPTRTINRQKSGSWKDARMIKTVYKHCRIKTKQFFFLHNYTRTKSLPL